MTQPAIPILFLHGFLSSSQGSKARFLADRLAGVPAAVFHAVEFNPTARDFEFMTVTGQINRLRQFVLDHRLERVNLIGSSLGGQVALNYAHRYGGVNQLLLLAPALHYSAPHIPPAELADWEAAGVRHMWHDGFGREAPLRYQFHLDRLTYAEPPPPPAPTVIIHGRGDEVVPLAGSRAYAAAFPRQVTLIEVDSDHRLGDQSDLIWQQVLSLIQ
ncbi:MAG: alpha/beta fold hydrolase [Anaerolineae bacterium]